MQRMRGLILVGVMAAALGGCAAESASTGAPAGGGAADISGRQSADNPLAKIQPGMSKQQVKALLGAPSAESSHITAKAYIPLYFGNDAHRTTYYYKGTGRVVFADGNVFGGGGGPAVVQIDYDPSETGGAR